MTAIPTKPTFVVRSSPTFELAHERKYHVDGDTKADGEMTDTDMESKAMDGDMPPAGEKASEANETGEPSDDTSEPRESRETTSPAEVAEPPSTPVTDAKPDPLSSVGTIAITAIVLVPITLWMLKR